MLSYRDELKFLNFAYNKLSFYTFWGLNNKDAGVVQWLSVGVLDLDRRVAS